MNDSSYFEYHSDIRHSHICSGGLIRAYRSIFCSAHPERRFDFMLELEEIAEYNRKVCERQRAEQEQKQLTEK